VKVTEEAKDKDLMIEGRRIMLTGRSFLLQDRHGVVFETEVPYSSFETEDGKKVSLEQISDLDLIYENHIAVSIGLLTRHGKFVKKERPEGFVSNSTEGLELQIETEMEQFVEKYSNRIKTPKMNRYNMEGGVTLAPSEGACFMLDSAAVLSENKNEVIKRIKISAEILRDMLENENKTNSFFDQIDEEMKSLGCRGYTFKRPDGETYLTRDPASKTIELRAYGMAKD